MTSQMKHVRIFVACIAILCMVATLHSAEQTTDIAAPIQDKHGIWQLTDTQFDPFLESHETVAVLFTRSDDLYSYAGKYHFDRAAHILRDLRNATTEFAVIEGDRAKSTIHDEFGIGDEQYPLLKFCHHDYLSPSLQRIESKSAATAADDKQWEIRCLDYNHRVIELMVVQWVEGLNRMCPFVIDGMEAFETAKQQNEILVVGFFESGEQLEAQLFDDLCKQYRWEKNIWAYQPHFAVVVNPEVIATLTQSAPTIIVYCQFKEHAWIYNGPMTDRAALQSFIETERYPYFTQITAFNFKQYTQELDIPLLWVAIDDSHDSYVQKVGRFYEQVGIDYKGYLSIIWISARSFMGHIRKLGFPFIPGVMYIDARNNYKQLYDPQASLLDRDRMVRFIDSAIDGSGEPFVKSQTEDEVQHAISNDRATLQKDDILIRHVTGAELYRILEKDEANYARLNVVVFYYAPWDSRCHKFHRVYERIAESLVNEDGTPKFEDLLLLKMDATENDAPHEITQFPKIYLYKNENWPKTEKDENWMVYTKRREENRFIAWLGKMCGYEMEDADVPQTVVSVGVQVDGEQQEQPTNGDAEHEYEEQDDEDDENATFEYV